MQKKLLMTAIVGWLLMIGYSFEYLWHLNPVTVAASSLFFISVLFIFKSQRVYLRVFNSGYLVFVMRWTYIDRFEFAERLNLLIILTLLITVAYMLIHRRNYLVVVQRFNRLSVKRRSVLLFLIFELFFIWASMKLVDIVEIPLGDEPHYMVIGHSIAKDGDINVFNQYARSEYREFINYRLQSHAKEGKGFKKWYSIHLPGLSLTISPFFLLSLPLPILYFLIRAFLGLFGAALIVLIYRFILLLWNRENLALYFSLVFGISAPIALMSVHIYAEIQAALFVLTGLYILIAAVKREQGCFEWKSFLIAGGILGISIFWGLKYILFLIGFLSIFGIYLLHKRSFKSFLALIVFPIILLSLFIYFLHFAYGSISPTAIYTGLISEAEKAELIENTQSIPLKLRVETLLDYFFDQRDGLFLYMPLYLFFFPGLILALINFKKYRPHLIISAIGFIYILYHAYSTIRAGYCPQGRYLTPVTWLFLLFTIIYYIETENRILKRLFYIIPVYTLFVTVFQVLHPFTLYQQTTHDSLSRFGLMFQKWGNSVADLSAWLPSFAKLDGNENYLPNILFLGIFILFCIFALVKTDRFKWGIVTVPLAIFFVVVTAFPRMGLYNPHKIMNRDNPSAVPFTIYGNRLYGHRIMPSANRSLRKGEYQRIVFEIPKRYLTRERSRRSSIFLKFKFNTVVNNVLIDIFNGNRIMIKKSPITNPLVKLSDLRPIRLGSRVLYVLNVRMSGDNIPERIEYAMRLEKGDNPL